MKRIILVAALVLLALCVAAGTLSAAGKAEGAKDSSAPDRLKAIGFSPVGMPIVGKPVTIRAVAVHSLATRPAYKDMEVIKELMAKSNVNVEFEELPPSSGEKINLMFASRDFPDVTFSVGVSNKNLWGAAQGSDVWPLNDLIEKYAPNWQKAFQERPQIKKANTFPDGKIYSLPYYREILNDYGIRDTQFINVKWLKDLGLKMPGTTEELYQALKGFRKGITDGLLPKNGIPMAVWYHAWSNGGEWEIYNAFGLWMKGQGTGAERYLSVNNGKVEFGATDPRLKGAADYLHKLYAEKLVSEDMFTISGNDHTIRIRTNPPIVGVAGEYFIQAALEEYFDPLPPVAGPDGTRRFRSTPVRMENNKFVLYRKLANPEVMVRFIDNWAEQDFAARASYGGSTLLANKDGTYTTQGTGEDWYKYGPHNQFPTFISKATADRIVWTGEQGEREKNVRNVFLPYLWPQERHYTNVTYTDAEQEELAILNKDVGDYVKSAIANWIVKGGAEAGWDEYLKQLEKLGLSKAMKIYQTAYDRYSKG